MGKKRNEDQKIKPTGGLICERFWKGVGQRGEGCWEWTGSRTSLASGGEYGRVIIGRIHIKAHRLSYQINVGPIPKGLFVCHRCDNPPCVNPDHLYVGTQFDNMRDVVVRGRRVNIPHQGKVESFPWAKLTRTQALDIRSRDYSKRGTKTRVSEEFGISPSSVNQILRGLIWKE